MKPDDELVKENVLGKRKRKDPTLSNTVDLAILAELKGADNKKDQEDEDSLFLKSLVPLLKRLDQKTKAKAKCQIQQLLFEYEFGK